MPLDTAHRVSGQSGHSGRGCAVGLGVQGLGRHGANAISRADGRLAGLTNQQVQRAGDRHPFVLVTECAGNVATLAPTYLARLEPERAQVDVLERDRDQIYSRRPILKGRKLIDAQFFVGR